MQKLISRVRASLFAHPTFAAVAGYAVLAGYDLLVGDRSAAADHALKALAFLGIHLNVTSAS